MPGRYYEKLKLSKELLGFRETFLALQLCDKKIISLTLNYFSCQAEFSTVCYIGILHILCADFDIVIALVDMYLLSFCLAWIRRSKANCRINTIETIMPTVYHYIISCIDISTISKLKIIRMDQMSIG